MSFNLAEYTIAFEKWSKKNCDKIREQREKRNLTQDGLAELIGWDRQKFNRLENNKFTPDARDILTICEELGCEPEYILRMQEEKHAAAGEVMDITGLTESSVDFLSNLLDLDSLYDYETFAAERFFPFHFKLAFINYFINEFQTLDSYILDAYKAKRLDKDPYAEEIRKAYKKALSESTGRVKSKKRASIQRDNARVYVKKYDIQKILEDTLERKYKLRNYEAWEIAKDKLDAYYHILTQTPGTKITDFNISDSFLQMTRRFVDQYIDAFAKERDAEDWDEDTEKPWLDFGVRAVLEVDEDMIKEIGIDVDEVIDKCIELLNKEWKDTSRSDKIESGIRSIVVKKKTDEDAN